jgi:hypothetical protein
MSLSGNTSLDIYRDYGVSDLQTQREAQRRRQRNVKSTNKTNESQSGTRLCWPELRGKVWVKQL